MRTSRPRRAIIGLCVAALCGCQLFVSSDVQQCSADGDCIGRAGDFTGTVCVDSLCVPPGDRCVGHVIDPIEDRTVPLHSRLRFVDVGGTPLKGVEVLVCAALDEACGSPVGAPVLTDADGYAYLTAWKNFTGSFQVLHPPSADYLKIKIHIFGGFTADDPPNKQLPVSQSVRLITKALFTLQLGARAEFDPNAGQIFGSALDCDMNPRGGVRVSIHTDAPGNPLLFYFTENMLVSTDATETPSSGLFGVANVPEGPLEVETTTATGRKLGRAIVWLNKGTISNFAIRPSQNP